MKVITEEPYREIGEEAVLRAKKVLGECEVLLDTGVAMGPGNVRVRELTDLARAQGKYRKVQSISTRNTTAMAAQATVTSPLL